VSGRAGSVVDGGLVGDVRVVGFVEVAAVPAALEVDLGAHAIAALCVVHVGFLDDAGFVNAVETDAVGDGTAWVVLCAVGHCGVVVASCRLVAGQDHKAFGERHCLCGIRSTSEIVDDGAAVSYFEEGAVGVFVVKRRRPVCRLV
jgi:hypothetical protein